jgi:hypothetical protein
MLTVIFHAVPHSILDDFLEIPFQDEGSDAGSNLSYETKRKPYIERINKPNLNLYGPILRLADPEI